MKTHIAFSAKPSKGYFLALAAGLALAATATSHAQTLVLSLQASNYNATNGVWTDSSGNADNATVSFGSATLTTGATPNGSSAVTFNGATAFTLATAIPASSSYTTFVFLKPSTTGGNATIFGGSSGSFQFRLSSGKQDVVQQGQVDAGSSNTTLSTTAFSTIDATAGSSGGAFRLNGTADGTSGTANFGQSISYIGANSPGGVGGTEYFAGSIADIEIYSGTLTAAQIQGVEATFNSRYVNAVPEPGTWAMALIGVGLLATLRRFRSTRA